MGWARRGLITPTRGATGAFCFSFQDVAVLRRIRALLDADVPLRRVHEALEAVRGTLPVGRPLSAIEVSALGHRVLVRDESSVWEPNSGQLELDFERMPEATGNDPKPLELVRIGPPSADGALGVPVDDATRSADSWYDEALDLEAEQPERAIPAYERAIELDPQHAEAHLNLGRILHEHGRLAQAEVHYRRALAAAPDNARAVYNLGVALEDRNRPSEAKAAYERAVALDPDLAAAHFNLSRLLEREGSDADALGHLAEYKRLVDRRPHTE